MSGLSNDEDTLDAAVEVVEELTEEELADRHRLELKVERAFFEAGLALRELRDKRLYKNTHRTFEEYCQNRFGFNRTSAHYKIGAAQVFETLFTFSKQSEPEEVSKQMFTFSKQILPTKETQVRPLIKLEPEEQLQVWQRSVEAAGGKVPTERLVKAEVLRHLGIVERLKEKHHISATEFYKIGDVFRLTALSGAERKYNGCWAIAFEVRDFTIAVDVYDRALTVKPDNLDPIDLPDVRRQLPQTLKRIRSLRSCDSLDRCAYTVLESLGRQMYLTDFEDKLLTFMEQNYGIEN